MEIYIFNYTTKRYEYARNAQKSPLEPGGFLIPTNATKIKPPEIQENTMPYFIDGEWVLKPYYYGQWQVQVSAKSVSKINYEGELQEGHQLITPDEAEEIMKHPDRWGTRNNVFIRYSDEEYNIRQLLKENKIAFDQATTDYLNFINIPVVYENGYTYKPEYARGSYESLFNAEKLAQELGQTTFPQYIKDSTKTNERAVMMSYGELLRLSFFLANLDWQAWRIKADKEDELISEETALLQQLSEFESEAS
jgi:hypothetical protein